MRSCFQLRNKCFQIVACLPGKYTYLCLWSTLCSCCCYVRQQREFCYDDARSDICQFRAICEISPESVCIGQIWQNRWWGQNAQSKPSGTIAPIDPTRFIVCLAGCARRCLHSMEHVFMMYTYSMCNVQANEKSILVLKVEVHIKLPLKDNNVFVFCFFVIRRVYTANTQTVL